jgi:hypothetical protein
LKALICWYCVAWMAGGMCITHSCPYVVNCELEEIVWYPLNHHREFVITAEYSDSGKLKLVSYHLRYQ